MQSLGQEDPLEEGMATHSSIHAGRIPRTEEPGRLQSIGSKKVRHNGSDLVCTLVGHEADWSLDQKRKTNKKLPRIVWGQSETTQYGLCVN